jgi:hypothetical protein
MSETETEEHEAVTDRPTTKKDNRLKRKGSGGRLGEPLPRSAKDFIS